MKIRRGKPSNTLAVQWKILFLILLIQELKDKYGDEIVFWGAGVDTQKTLPFGSPEEVRKQVLERCEIFSPHGGFIFNAIHNVQARTPVENIVAMIDAVKEFNGEK